MDDGDRTLAAYEAGAAAYLAAHGEPPAPVVEWMRRFAALVPGGRVLELGSGPGTDADLLEGLGLRVLRSDAAAAFVDRLRDRGHEVLRLDVRADPLPAPVDGVFANAVLLHLERDGFGDVLRRVREALVPGGVLACSLKEGDGVAWSGRNLGLPRRFTYWRAPALRVALEDAGLDVLAVEAVTGSADDWLQVLARRPGGEGQRARGCAVV